MRRMSAKDGPRIRVSGEVHRKQSRGFGPFRKTVWSIEPFEVSLETTGSIDVSDVLQFTLESAKDGWALGGKVSGIQCVFATIPASDGPVKQNFAMLSVSKVNVTGTITTE